LFRPNHSGERLALDVARVGIGVVRLQGLIKFISLAQARGKGSVEIGEWLRAHGFAEAQAHIRRPARRNRQLVERAGFRAGAVGIHCGLISMNDVFVEAVLEKALCVRLTVKSARIRFVVAEQ
jgi:hypothetical protein